ncbi:MAG: hypothetical protein ABIS36_07255 [Chryseolinea sp.]
MRNLLKNRTFSIVNVLGLRLSTAVLIILWVIDERSIVKFHAPDSQLYAFSERQSKEIGIRKYEEQVLSRDSVYCPRDNAYGYLPLLIASPLAWYFMDNWTGEYE